MHKKLRKLAQNQNKQNVNNSLKKSQSDNANVSLNQYQIHPFCLVFLRYPLMRVDRTNCLDLVIFQTWKQNINVKPLQCYVITMTIYPARNTEVNQNALTPSNIVRCYPHWNPHSIRPQSERSSQLTGHHDMREQQVSQVTAEITMIFVLFFQRNLSLPRYVINFLPRQNSWNPTLPSTIADKNLNNVMSCKGV